MGRHEEKTKVRTAEELRGLFDTLNHATLQYRAMCDKREAASRDATEALNALNRAQKAVDAALEGMRQDSPRGSDWNRPRGLPVGP